jgi:hypothetical protein
MAIETDPKEKLCVGCKKVLRRFLFICPACKDARCFPCFDRHLTAKTCAYGKAKVLSMRI